MLLNIMLHKCNEKLFMWLAFSYCILSTALFYWKISTITEQFSFCKNTSIRKKNAIKVRYDLMAWNLEARYVQYKGPWEIEDRKGRSDLYTQRPKQSPSRMPVRMWNT